MIASRSSPDNLPASETLLSRSSQDGLPSTPQTAEENGGRYNSLRSILREKNTPGTGQSVRFFSRDAYKVITPNTSAQSSELDDPSFFTRLQQASKNTAASRSETARPSARDIFANCTNDPSTPTSPIDSLKAHDINSLMMPVPPPNLSNIFDLSQEQQPSAIFPGEHPILQDNAIEVQDESSSIVMPAPGAELLLQASPFPSELSSSTSKPPGDETNFFSPTDELNSPLSPLNKPFNFGRPVFRPLPLLPAEPPLPPTPTESSSAPSINSDKRSSKSSESASLRKPSRSRAISDTVFQAMIRTASISSSKDSIPESDINDKSAADLSFEKPVPDPFSIDATTYYTPGTMMPPTPPQSTHARTASREDDFLWFLRTQLAIQQELNVQYEVDLSARNDLVSSLASKLELADKDKTQRTNTLRSWKRKVQELEKACRQLEDECERSRQESFERSVIDHASGEALRELHRVIACLEREKADSEKFAQEQVQKLTDELKRREDSEKRLREGINEAKEQMEMMGGREEEEEQRQRQRTVSLLWNQEREELIRKVEELENKNLTLASKPSESEKLAQRYADLQAELEAQWRNTETMTQEIAELKKGQDTLQQKVIDLEGDWNESENRRLQLEAEVEEVRTVCCRFCFSRLISLNSYASSLKLNKMVWTNSPKHWRNRKMPFRLWKRTTSCPSRLFLDSKPVSPSGTLTLRYSLRAQVNWRGKMKRFVTRSEGWRRSAGVRLTNSPANFLNLPLVNLNPADNWRASFPKRRSPKSSSTPSRTVLGHWTRKLVDSDDRSMSFSRRAQPKR
jgi:hypothetical protein